MRAESLHAIVLLAAVAGLGLSVFAYAESVDPVLRADCSVNVFFSCAKVDQSGQTTTLGVPDWAIGASGFLALLAIDIPLYVSWRPTLLRALALVSGLGVGFSVYLAYIELFRIDALCPVCLSAYLANVAVFVGAGALLWKARETDASRDLEREPAASREASPRD